MKINHERPGTPFANRWPNFVAEMILYQGLYPLIVRITYLIIAKEIFKESIPDGGKQFIYFDHAETDENYS